MFGITGKVIRIQNPQQTAITLLNLIHLNLGVIDRNVLALDEFETKEFLGQNEYPHLDVF